MVKMFKSVKRELWEVEQIEHIAMHAGHVTMFNIGTLSIDDVVGVQSFENGCYLGKTVLLQPISVHYDKWGFPFYRLKIYSKPTRQSEYHKFRTSHLNWWGY